MKSNLILVALAVLLFPAASFAQFRTAQDPAVKEYLEAYEAKVEAEKKAERQDRWDDPHRKLRPYLTLDEIYGRMDETARQHPAMVTVSEYGKSVEGRPLQIMKISVGDREKPSMLYSANIHGNEMAGNMICLAIIDYFVEGYGSDRDVTWLLDRLDIYVVPVLNPDGMAATVRQQDRYGTVVKLARKNANGVDLNRNFPYPEEALTRLKDSAGSNRKWMTNYRGPAPLSEPETKAIDRLFAEKRFIVHMNYHTTGGIILSPPATLPEAGPDDDLHADMRKDYQSEMFNEYVEHTELQFYPTIGSLDDYVYHRYGTKCITVEVGKEPFKRALLGCHNFSCSPLFWLSNVHYIDREIANNLDGAVRMAWWALDIEEKGLSEWGPPDKSWVGEPLR